MGFAVGTHMTARSRFSMWSGAFFGAAVLFALGVFGVVQMPDGLLAPTKILLFGAVLLGCLAIANAVHERRLN